MGVEGVVWVGGGKDCKTRVSRAHVDPRKKLLSLPASERIASRPELSFSLQFVCPLSLSLGSNRLETDPFIKLPVRGHFLSERQKPTFWHQRLICVHYIYHYLCLEIQLLLLLFISSASFVQWQDARKKKKKSSKNLCSKYSYRPPIWVSISKNKG